MTIAAGFVCSDGLLFASDTLHTGDQITHGRKLWTVIRGDVVVIFGGAGTEVGLKRSRDEIDARLTGSMTAHETRQCVEDSIAHANAGLDPNWEKTSALVGIRHGATRGLLMWNQGGGHDLIPLDNNSESVGWGRSLGNYFLRSLFRTNMPIEWAKVVAAHLIKNVKQYEPSACGGKTHLLLLPDTGQPDFIGDSRQSEIVALEQRLADVDDVIRMVLPDGSHISDHTLNERLRRANDVIKNLRNDQFIALPTIHDRTSFVGGRRHGAEFYFGGAWLNDGSGGTPLPLRAAAEAAKQTPNPSDPTGTPDPEDPKGGS